MEYQVYDLGNRKSGEIVQVKISGNAANVRLMDSSNYNSYKSGRRHTYYGGHATRSPVNISVPSSGHWYVAIDFGGYRGSARTSVQVLSGTLPELRQPPLSSLPSLRLDRDSAEESPVYSPSKREYDVFISHASEDKEAVVRPLALKLQELGLIVWYDEFEMRIGDSLRRKIDQGLARSRFGIVVLSTAFIGKGWTNYELDGIITKAISGQQVMLPIWHNITKQQVIDYSPSLADKLARNTAVNTIEEIATEICEVVNS